MKTILFFLPVFLVLSSCRNSIAPRAVIVAPAPTVNIVKAAKDVTKVGENIDTAKKISTEIYNEGAAPKSEKALKVVKELDKASTTIVEVKKELAVAKDRSELITKERNNLSDKVDSLTKELSKVWTDFNKLKGSYKLLLIFAAITGGIVLFQIIWFFIKLFVRWYFGIALTSPLSAIKLITSK